MNNRLYQLKKKQNKKENNKLYFYIFKFFAVIIIFVFGSLLIRKNTNFKALVLNKVYKNNISFAYIKNVYNKYIGNILPFQNILKEKKVFSEKLEYNSLSKYDNGIKLTLNDSYLVPIIKEGIVVFIGEKENYGNTVIVSQTDGINTWYGNLSNVNVKLYDNVETNSILGEVKNNELYMLFERGGAYIDYKEVLK